MEWIIGAVIFAVILYVALSPDPLASAIRARIPWAQRKAANVIDSVESRTAAAASAQEGTVRRGRRSLYDVQSELAASEIELNRAAEEVDEDNAALALARKNNDRETFETLAAELNRDTAYHGQLMQHHQALVNELKSLEVAVDEQRDKARAIAMQGSLMRSQARVADVVTQVHEAQAGLNENGAEAQMDEAQKILDHTMARATASQAAAQGLTPNERAEKKAAAYIKQVQQGGSGVNADELWNQMSTPAASSG